MSRGAFALCIAFVLTTSLLASEDPFSKMKDGERLAAIRRAQVWIATDVPSMDLKAGPQDGDGFLPEATVECVYTEKKVTSTPKFWCELQPGEEVKVKYGETNGEVYGEVAASRLLWALGFGADRMYPVKVVCRNCPENAVKHPKPVPGVRTFEPAALERKMPGDTMETKPDSGWAWGELNAVDPGAGGAPLAHRDALKLLATMIQHTDSKAAQQRLVCLDALAARSGKNDKADKAEKNDKNDQPVECEHTFMMLNDLGRTFGKANAFNRDLPGSVDLKSWSKMDVWKDKTSCVANLPKSMSGTLDSPAIGEAGRAFLAGLLTQLSDQQIHDLFDVSRFTRRQPSTTVDDWVAAFKRKRDDIATRTCGR